MSDARPHDETDEVEALIDETQVDESAGPDDEGVAPTVEGGDDATDDTGQPVEDAGTGTADTSEDPQLDSPD